MKTNIIYNFDLLLSCVAKYKASIDENLYKDNINFHVNSIITATCNCGNMISKKFIHCISNGGMFCQKCVMLNRKDKIKQFNLKHYGVINPMQSLDIKNKLKKADWTNSNRIRYNNKYFDDFCNKHNIYLLEDYSIIPLNRNSVVKAKCLTTGCTKEVEKNVRSIIRLSGTFCTECTKLSQKQKTKQSSLEKYGTENPMQNPYISEKNSRQSYLRKEYTLPSGNIAHLQGYEPLALDILLQTYSESDIITSRKEVPVLWWKFENDMKQHRHFVDIYIPSKKLCVEVKSTWTFHKNKDKVFSKQISAKSQGYEYEIWVFNGKKQLIYTIY